VAALAVSEQSRPDDDERQVCRLAAKEVPIARIAQQTGLPPRAVEAILRGAPWRHLVTPRAIGDLFRR
jgi:hypothetical protein